MKINSWIAIVSSFILVLMLLPGCAFFGQVTGAGETIDRLYNMTGFTEIEIGTAIEFVIVPLDSYSISIRTNENIFDYIDVASSEKTLIIRMKPISYTKTSVVATITLPALERISITGTAHGKVKGFKSDRSFTLQASGDSTMELDMETGATGILLSDACIIVGRLLATDIILEASGNSRTSLNGSANNLTLKAGDDTLANLPDCVLQNARVSLSGSSQANLNIMGRLDAELRDASKLNYSGSPTMGKIDVRGESIISGP